MTPLPRGTTDETGHRYGRLLVVSYAGRDQPQGQALWLCRCDCGGAATVRGAKLRAGSTVSCGCERADSGVRQAARGKVGQAKRREIAEAGARARWGR